MDKTSLFFICGAYNLLFAIFHLFFWKLFHWKEDLRKLTVGNRAIIQILNIRLIYVFLLAATIYLFFYVDLATTNLGFAFQIGFLVFWIGRTVEQFVFLRIKSRMVNILTAVFFIGIVIHLLPLVFS